MTSGATFFPGAGNDGPLGQAPTCDDCQWRLTPNCLQPSPDGACSSAVSACPAPGEISYRVYVRHGSSGAWELAGTVCLGPGEKPVPVSDLSAAVRERVVSLLPQADPSFQPPGGGIVNLPTIFAAGEPAVARPRPFSVVGLRVRVVARASWTWHFQPGVDRSFAKPGGAWPDESVSWTYTATGTRLVSVQTSWRATFRVEGAGPFPVLGGPITTTAQIRLPVRQAHAELVATP